ncbi:hypothetical protein NHX12_003176 [Muraenolepis orangiensis]|uniref:Uncharacterized protein n=1 Tax=Muraenolepis orangiensis TaxID=630683 RepID=A0A9Q0DXJ2_9TELE|nr:hypothetical protein NHX12_003176 [Muraenolepis orangiensis]
MEETSVRPLQPPPEGGEETSVRPLEPPPEGGEETSVRPVEPPPEGPRLCSSQTLLTLLKLLSYPYTRKHYLTLTSPYLYWA